MKNVLSTWLWLVNKHRVLSTWCNNVVSHRCTSYSRILELKTAFYTKQSSNCRFNYNLIRSKSSRQIFKKIICSHLVSYKNIGLVATGAVVIMSIMNVCFYFFFVDLFNELIVNKFQFSFAMSVLYLNNIFE